MTAAESAVLIESLTKDLAAARGALQAERVYAENLKQVAIAAVRAGVYQVRELQEKLDRGQSRAAGRAVPQAPIMARSVADP